MEDAQAEGGEGALLDGVVCFRGQTVGEKGGDGEVEKDFAGDFWGEGSEGHFELNDRSCYNVEKEDSVKMYGSDMQPRRQFCIERRITLPLSLYSTFPIKRREKKRNLFHQATPIYLTPHRPSSHHPTTDFSMTPSILTPDPITRPSSSSGTPESHSHTPSSPSPVLEPYTPQKAQAHGSPSQNTHQPQPKPNRGAMHVIPSPPISSRLSPRPRTGHQIPLLSPKSAGTNR